MKIISKNAAQTKKIAADLAKKILKSPPRQKHARVIALVGDLGAGKTTFVQGFAKGLGIKHRIVSPTFLIVRNYELRIMNYDSFYHIDTYRIQNVKELNTLDFKKILADPKNIVLIEWADKIKKILPKDTIWIQFSHSKKENERVLTVNF